MNTPPRLRGLLPASRGGGRRRAGGANRPMPAFASAYVGWVPFLCVLAAIALLATSAITWVTAPNWGLHNVIAAPRTVGTVPLTKASPVDAHAPDISISPYSIEVPAIKAQAPILEIGTTADRELEPPQDPTEVGWWKYGAKPGATVGTAIITGHINYAGVAGALGEIGRLNPGDKIIVHGMRHGKRATLTFTVTGVQTYSKQKLPWAQIFDQHVAGRLALITCGGPFDQSTGNYLDNIVAYAVLGDATAGAITPAHD